jgi:hypothetical protein
MITPILRVVRGASVVLALIVSASPGAAQNTAANTTQRAELAAVLTTLRRDAETKALPTADAFTFGDREVLPGAEPGPVAVANGTLHVRGTVNGDAASWHGNIVVHEGGRITGNAWAIGGKVLLVGGTVEGDMRALDGDFGPLERVPARLDGAAAVLHQGALAFGWLVVLLAVGIGVLVFASPNLDTVGDGISRGFGRAFFAGLAAQFALLPLMILMIVALCLTVLGILLIPFAIVAYVLAAAGLVTLGYLAMAQVTGQAFVGVGTGAEIDRRTKAFKSMLLGLVVLLAPWFVASALAWSPKGELVMHTLAVAITWVAGTAGLGAALMSRGGKKRPMRADPNAATSTGWATPTPVAGVAGVAGARRPESYTTGGTPQ